MTNEEGAIWLVNFAQEKSQRCTMASCESWGGVAEVESHPSAPNTANTKASLNFNPQLKKNKLKQVQPCTRKPENVNHTPSSEPHWVRGISPSVYHTVIYVIYWCTKSFGQNNCSRFRGCLNSEEMDTVIVTILQWWLFKHYVFIVLIPFKLTK